MSVDAATERVLYPIWVGGQRFAIDAAAIHSVERIRDIGSATTWLHTAWGRVPLYDLRAWVGARGADQTYRPVLLLHSGARFVGVVIDRIDDEIRHAGPLMSLPAVVLDAIVDPTISGVIVLDETPCLVLDLEPLIVMHLPPVQPEYTQ